ncbi:MAG: DUF3520 domain-containing protein, partial [Desulfobacterales bacterium]|nr:DUF3520 domain-containing protein [Desulfobacterales bacterium]
LSDGDANIGPSSHGSILELIEDHAGRGITMSTVGFGTGNYKDTLMEQLANKGDGNYYYIDSYDEAKKVFGADLSGTLQTIAKDAKIQVEFNTTRVRRYRLIGYENRDIADKDFRNDAVDAGEVGSGQAATALYELELYPSDRPAGDPPAIGTVYVRYRNADNDKVEEIAHTIANDAVRETTIAERPRFYLAAAVARFAELLRESPHARDGNFDDVSRVVDQVHAELPLDDRIAELRDLVRQANNLDRAP